MPPVRVDNTQNGTSAAESHPSLEEPAFLPGPPRAWALKLYPDGCEGTLWRRSAPPSAVPEVRLEPTADERAAVAADCARRAAGEVRRYIRANRCDHLWTFTFEAPVHDYAQLAPIAERFLERLAAAGFAGALILVPEPHPQGHGWHLHGALKGRFPHRKMWDLWGHGFVYVTGPRSGSFAGWNPKRLSRYLAKYLGKTLDSEELHGCTPRAKGAHRYFRTKGHDPAVVRRDFDTLVEATRWLERRMGKPAVALPLATGDAFRPEGWWLAWDDPPRRRPPRSP
jgi:hypothetical protein